MLSRVMDTATLVRVQSWDAAARVPHGVAHFLEVDWPERVGSVANATDALAVVCIGPTDWLVLAKPRAGLMRSLDEQLRGSPFCTTDVTGAFVRLRIEGPHARALLSKVCALDVYSDELRPARSPRTLVAGLVVIVRCVAESTYEFIVARSCGDYLLSWLADAAREYSSEPGATA